MTTDTKLISKVVPAFLPIKYKEIGFRLYQFADDMVALDFKDFPVKTYSYREVCQWRVSQDCENYLEVLNGK